VSSLQLVARILPLFNLPFFPSLFVLLLPLPFFSPQVVLGSFYLYGQTLTLILNIIALVITFLWIILGFLGVRKRKPLFFFFFFPHLIFPPSLVSHSHSHSSSLFSFSFAPLLSLPSSLLRFVAKIVIL
jgi:hypothetical protein